MNWSAFSWDNRRSIATHCSTEKLENRKPKARSAARHASRLFDGSLVDPLPRLLKKIYAPRKASGDAHNTINVRL